MNRSNCFTRITVFGLCAASLLGADETARLTAVVKVARTEKADFPANGTLRLEKSAGELTIEGWNESNAEITTIKSTRTAQPASDHDKALQELERVHVTARRDGSDLVVATEMPTHRAFPFVDSLSVVENFDLETHIKVPRNATLIVKHTDGEVHIDDIAGNIEVTARQGLIALHLSGDSPRAIDAKTDYGSVNSDFPGKETLRPWPTGHTLIDAPSAAPQRLHLRIFYGDIVLLKARDPKAPTSLVTQK